MVALRDILDVIQGAAAGASGQWELHPEAIRRRQLQQQLLKEQAQREQERWNFQKQELERSIERGKTPLSQFIQPEIEVPEGPLEGPYVPGVPTGRHELSGFKGATIADLPVLSSLATILQKEGPKLQAFHPDYPVYKGGKLISPGKPVLPKTKYAYSPIEKKTIVYNEGEKIPDGYFPIEHIPSSEMPGKKPIVTLKGTEGGQPAIETATGELEQLLKIFGTTPQIEQPPQPPQLPLSPQVADRWGLNIPPSIFPFQQPLPSKQPETGVGLPWKKAEKYTTPQQIDDLRQGYEKEKLVIDAKHGVSFDPVTRMVVGLDPAKRGAYVSGLVGLQQRYNRLAKIRGIKEPIFPVAGYGIGILDEADKAKLKQFDTPDGALSYAERLYRIGIITEEERDEATSLINQNREEWDKWRRPSPLPLGQELKSPHTPFIPAKAEVKEEGKIIPRKSGETIEEYLKRTGQK